MKQMRSYLSGLYKEIVLGPIFKLLEAILELLVPLVMAGIIDTGIRNGDTAYILQRGGMLVGIAVLSVVVAITCQYYAARAASQYGARLRAGLYRHVMRFSGDETEKYGSGGLITRLTNDVNSIQTGLNMAIRLASRVPFLIIGSIVMAMILNFRIGLVFLISTPLIIAVLYLVMKRTVPSYTAIQKGQDTLSRLSRENLEGTRVIRAFSRQNQEKAGFDAAAQELSDITIRVGKISAALNPLTTFIVNAAIIAIVWLGASFAFRGDIEPGQIIALVTYMNQTLLALIVAANLVVLFTRAIASLRRVAEVLDTQPAIVDGPGARPVAGAPALEFRDVSFAYHDGADNALTGISFTAAHGETIGIIGGTGSGKSTLAGLVLRNFDAGKGTVLIDGAPVRDYALADLRGRIGLVPQTAALFRGSVAYNLRISAPEAADAALWHALEVAQGAEFVQKLPEGLETEIDEGGKNLSGGQRQRLTIARALVRRPEILILDDSSSALDYATDAALRRALRAETAAPRESGPAMTTLLIAQRASSIKHADRILVLDDGRLVGSGTHEKLLQDNAIYREICQSQGIAAPGSEVAGL